MGADAARQAAGVIARKPHWRKRDSVLPADLSAIVCPLTPRELPLALKNLASWGEKMQPLRAGADKKMDARPRLVFSFNCAENEELSEPLRNAFDSQPVLKDSFRRIDFIFCDLPPEKDVYFRKMPYPPPEFGTKAGPNWLWHETLKALRGESGFIFLMETDCVPVAPNWLLRLDAVCRQNADAWIVGSHYCGASPLHWSIARHINGNALYHIGDPDFWKFIEDFFWPWLHKRIKEREPQLAYDCAWEIFLNRQEMERAGNIDWLTARRLMQRFRLSNFIVNIAGYAEQQGLYYWTRADVLKRYPNALFVHGPLARPDSYIRNGLALGKPVLHSAVTAEGRALRYQGLANKEDVRFRRSFWLPDMFLSEGSIVRLRFVLKSSPKAGVTVEINDSNGVPATMQRFEVYKEGNGRVCKLEYKPSEDQVFLNLVFRFDSREEGDAEHNIEISDTVLEVLNGEHPPIKVKRLFN